MLPMRFFGDCGRVLCRMRRENMGRMREPYLGDPAETIAVLNKYGFAIQKKYGQNFLIDRHVLDKIIRAADISG